MKVYIKSSDDLDTSLAFTGNTVVRERYAANTDDPELLTIYAHDPHQRVRGSAFANPNMPSEDIYEFISSLDFNNVSDTEVNILAGLAMNPNLPDDVLHLLATGTFLKNGNYDSSWYIRSRLAHNLKLDTSGLSELAEISSEDTLTLIQIAINPRTSVELLSKLARSDHWPLREAVGKNPQAPHDVFMLLARDASDSVRHVVASNPCTSEDILNMLARDTDYHIRKCVAENRGAPIQLLRRLAKDRSCQVRGALAINPNIDDDIRRALLNDRDERVRYNMQRNLS